MNKWQCVSHTESMFKNEQKRFSASYKTTEIVGVVYLHLTLTLLFKYLSRNVHLIQVLNYIKYCCNDNQTLIDLLYYSARSR